MDEYVLIGLDIKSNNRFYARCRELGIVSKFAEEDGLLFVVLELSEEDAIVLRLTFPDMNIKKFRHIINVQD